MKKLYILLVLQCVGCVLFAQTIRRVSNITGVTGVNVYTTAQAAHDAAAANDILIIEPSGVSYGDLTCTKPLKIYGNGYYLNVNTELKADQNASTLGYIYFNTGSGGSSVSGISASRVIIHGVNSITVSRNRLDYVFVYNSNKAGNVNTNVSGTLVSGNYLQYYCTLSVTSGYTITNTLILNNLIGYITGNNDAIQNLVVKNNTFKNYSLASTSISNAVFENNLCNQGGATTNFENVSVSYNVSTASSFSGGIGNQNNYDISSELVGSGAGISDDEYYLLKSGSPLKTAGSAGSEVGAFGGLTPYVVSGIPAIPSILNMTNSATGTTSNPLQVIISVKSNN